MRIMFLLDMLKDKHIDHKDEVLKAVKEEDWRFDGKVHKVSGIPCINLISNDSKCWLSHVPTIYFDKSLLKKRNKD